MGVTGGACTSLKNLPHLNREHAAFSSHSERRRAGLPAASI